MNTVYLTIEECLLDGGVAILRTDTVYGLVACANNQVAVEYVYALKDRAEDKPCIILVSSQEEIPFDQEVLTKVYTEANGVATSVVVPVHDQPLWLTRGGVTLAYRVPQDEALQKLLRVTGPLIAPSANPEGQPPARSIEEARAYFGDRVRCYLDRGMVPENIKASQIIQLHVGGNWTYIRQ